jgi:hypothetical protein
MPNGGCTVRFVVAAGVQRDALIYDDNFLDATWDAVWASAVRIGPEGDVGDHALLVTVGYWFGARR